MVLIRFYRFCAKNHYTFITLDLIRLGTATFTRALAAIATKFTRKEEPTKSWNQPEPMVGETIGFIGK